MDLLGGLPKNYYERNHLHFLHLLQTNLVKIVPYGVFQKEFELYVLS
jgi:hypothetical protein